MKKLLLICSVLTSSGFSLGPIVNNGSNSATSNEVAAEKMNIKNYNQKRQDVIDLSTIDLDEIYTFLSADKTFEWTNGENISEFTERLVYAMHEYFMFNFGTSDDLVISNASNADIKITLLPVGNENLELLNEPYEQQIMIKVQANNPEIASGFKTGSFNITVPAKIFDIADLFSKMQARVSATRFNVEDFDNGTYAATLDSIMYDLNLQPDWAKNRDIFAELQQGNFEQYGYTLNIEKEGEHDETFNITLGIDESITSHFDRKYIFDKIGSAHLRIVFGDSELRFHDFSVDDIAHDELSWDGGAFGKFRGTDTGWVTVVDFSNSLDFVNKQSIYDAYGPLNIKWSWAHNSSDGFHQHENTLSFDDTSETNPIAVDDWKDAFHSAYIEMYIRLTDDGLLQVFAKMHGYAAAWRSNYMEVNIDNVSSSLK